ncbi:MAG: ABC transporter substrate-binding protein [Clostridiaceae bacterium]|nr:ABC transporter substrate-binding protein [Clostridiaceae bacterium]
MNKKRLICTVLAGSMILSTLLSGCKTSKPLVESPKEELKPVELSWYFIGGGAAKDGDLVNTEISNYLKDKINAKLTITQFDWGTYDTKVGTMIAAGEPADLVFTCGWALPFKPNAQKGAFLELDDLLSKYGTNVKKILGPSYLAGGQLDGKQYAIPVNKDSAHSKGFMFNKIMVDKYKFDLTTVKKLEDLEPMLKIIKDSEKGNIVTNMGVGVNTGSGPAVLLDFDELSGDSNVPYGLMSNNDASNTKIVNLFDTKEMKEQLKVVRKFNQAGYVRADAPTMKTDPAESQGKRFVGFAQLKPNGDKEGSSAVNQRVQVEYTKPVSSNSDINNSMYAITKNSKNPERAMMLLDLMYTDKKLVNMAVIGIEGKHYTKIDENTYAPTATPLYTSSVTWQFGNQFLDLLNKEEDPKKWETLIAFNKAAVPLNSLGFSFDSTSVATELAAIGTVSKEYQPVILTGSVDPDQYLIKYSAKLKEAGEAKVMAEMQKQYDAFLKTKKK